MKYYLSSEPHFLVFVDMLLTNGFYKIFEKNGAKYEAISDVAVSVSEHAQIHNGFYLNHNVADAYFEKGYSDIQLFSIIFALILNLSEKEIEIIADKNNSSVSMSILHSILCGNDLKKINDFLYSGRTVPQKIEILAKSNFNGAVYYRPYPNENDYCYPWRSYFNRSSLRDLRTEEICL